MYIHSCGYGTRAPSDTAGARKTRRRKWFHFDQRYGTVCNDTHRTHSEAARRVASRRIASRSLASSLSCLPDKKNEVGFVCSFFSSHPSVLLCTRARAHAINNVCRVGFAYRAARSKGYATPDGHVSASRTGIHEDRQGLDRRARPYKGVRVREAGREREGTIEEGREKTRQKL